ncbi:hypothetical protein BIW11_09924 [Tropilaelaps mercedesae]|uniref:Transcription factor TFIIIC triple barrel domain-containing protein n=1 Tax=Tropilaelaps mercedesae TaxID=418985 RepID=A0A1V9XIE5_9ACAR|nr:hypothetical protein BIW11_09924 [Tropilaelaps mercedesae]
MSSGRLLGSSEPGATSCSSSLGSDWELMDSHEVFIELQGVTDLPPDITTSQCAFIKPDSERPLLKVRDFVYAGRYEDTVGTHLAFRVLDSNRASAGAGGGGDSSKDPIADAHNVGAQHNPTNKKLQFMGKTDKMLRMTPASVRNKRSSEKPREDGNTAESCDEDDQSGTV